MLDFNELSDMLNEGKIKQFLLYAHEESMLEKIVKKFEERWPSMSSEAREEIAGIIAEVQSLLD